MTTATEKRAQLCIATIEANNFHRLAVVKWAPFGRHTRIFGKNAVGKSTFINTAFAAISGKAGKHPIKEGSDQATLYVELADKETGDIVWRIKRVWNDKGMSLDLRKADGSKVKAPQSHLDQIALPLCFRPQEWERKREQDKLDDILRIYEVAVPVREVTAIVGEHHPAKQGESAAQYLDRLSADGTGLYFVRRLEKGRELLQKEKALNEFRPHLVEAPEGEEGDISELLAERSELDDRREVLRKAREKATAAKAEHSEMVRLKTQREKELEVSNGRIAALEAELARERAAAAEIARKIVNCTRRADELRTAAAAAALAVEALADPSPRIAEIDGAMAEVDQQRQAIAERKQARETALRLQDQHEECKREHAGLDIYLEALRGLRRNLLNGLDLGIDNLAVGDGELLLNGISFEEGSRAEKRIVASHLCMKQHPDLCFIAEDDAESFDEETEKAILWMATKFNWQAILSFVTRTDSELRIEYVEPTNGEAT